MTDDPLAAAPDSPLDEALGLRYHGRDGDAVVLRLEPTRAALGYEDPPMLHGGALVLSRTLELLGIDALYVSESDSLDAVAAGLLTGRRTR